MSLLYEEVLQWRRLDREACDDWLPYPLLGRQPFGCDICMGKGLQGMVYSQSSWVTLQHHMRAFSAWNLPSLRWDGCASDSWSAWITFYVTSLNKVAPFWWANTVSRCAICRPLITQDFAFSLRLCTCVRIMRCYHKQLLHFAAIARVTLIDLRDASRHSWEFGAWCAAASQGCSGCKNNSFTNVSQPLVGVFAFSSLGCRRSVRKQFAAWSFPIVIICELFVIERLRQYSTKEHRSNHLGMCVYLVAWPIGMSVSHNEGCLNWLLPSCIV